MGAGQAALPRAVTAAGSLAPLEHVVEEVLEPMVNKALREQGAADRAAVLGEVEARFAAALERDRILAGERPPQYVKCVGGKTHLGATLTHARCGWEFAQEGLLRLCEPIPEELCKACLRSRP